MTLYCFECGDKIRGFEKIISDMMAVNEKALPEKTKFLRKGDRCGIETDLVLSDAILESIQNELIRIHDATPDPEPAPFVPVEVVTLATLNGRLKEIESKINEVLKK